MKGKPIILLEDLFGAVVGRFFGDLHVVARSLLAAGFGAFSGAFGLLVSYHANFPSGPSIVLVAGVFYLVSLCFGTRDSFRLILFPTPQHKES